MDISRPAHRIAQTFRRGLAAVVLVTLAMAAPGPTLAAPADDSVLPPEQHTSEKGKRLAARYAPALHDLSAKVYHCMPWVEVKRNGIGFYKPKHLDGDLRYLSINLYIDQQPSPEFAAYTIEERASRMFSRYVGPMVRRMSEAPGLMADPSLDGFTVILEWLKDPRAHFRPQVDGDLVKDGVCGMLIAEKLGVSQPTASEHMRWYVRESTSRCRHGRCTCRDSSCLRAAATLWSCE